MQQDYGEWRTINDNFSDRCALRVFSGGHPYFKKYWPITLAITDLLLTRGDGATDQDMVEAVRFVGDYHLFGENEARARIEQVAKKGTLLVRKEACVYLADMGQPCHDS